MNDHAVNTLFEGWVERHVVHDEELDPAVLCADRPEELKALKALIFRYRKLSDSLDGARVITSRDPPVTAGRAALLPAIEGFRTIERIGAGGMGEVYKLQDLKLGRLVAAKVLRADLCVTPNLADFLSEAQALALFQDSRVVQIHELREQAVPPVLIMEYVDGFELGRLAPSLEYHQRARIVKEVCEAIHHAHQLGVQHRDLKPSNIMLDAQLRPKILDFGLSSSDPARGHFRGTPQYLAPEQLDASHPIDPRTDVYGLGAVLYEVLTGVPPVDGPTVDAIVANVRAGAVRLPDEISVGTPEPLQAIALKALETRPIDRYASAQEMALDLGLYLSGRPVTARPSRYTTILTSAARSGIVPKPGWSDKRLWLSVALFAVAVFSLTNREAPAPSAPKAMAPIGSPTTVSTAVPTATAAVVGRTAKAPGAAKSGKPARIVVLPFENLGAPEDAYFAPGLTEAFISRLSNLQGLSVISRTTARVYDRKGRTAAQIGTDLGVDFVLEGGVSWDRGAGRENRVRITPALTQVTDDTQVWAGEYDRVTSDISAIQSEVAENVVRAIGVKLAPREKTALRAVSTNDMEAYSFYLRGLQLADRGQTKDLNEGALQMFQMAVGRDPRFTQALARLARTHMSYYSYYDPKSQEHIDKGRDALDRLRALGPDLAESHVARGYFHYFLRDYPRALDEFKAALSLQPSNSDALEGMGYILRGQGLWRESAEATARWLEIDPRSHLALTQHGQTCGLLRRYAEADRDFALALLLNPQNGPAWGWRASIQLLWHGDVEKAGSLVSEARKRQVSLPFYGDSQYKVAHTEFRIALIRRDSQAALRLLDGEKGEAFDNRYAYLPIENLRGEVHRLSGADDLARISFEASRRRLQELIAREPDESRYHSALGIASAGLGLREEALRAATRGTELMPASRELWRALWRIEDLALVHTMLGQQDEAIERLDFLLSRTGEISTHMLRLEPRWDPLKSNPRFQALLAKYGDPPS